MKNKQLFVFILGTRPEIIKQYPLIIYAQKHKLNYYIIHTNQHYNANMDEIFFKELGLPKANYNLHIGSGTQGDQTGRMLIEIEKVLLKIKPTHVFVQGDTNTVLAGALVSSKLHIKVCHIEAGLRSYDNDMPEEVNRIISDHISDYLFCPTKKQANILIKEGIDKKKIFITGNTIVDAVHACSKLKNKEIKNESFLLTCHRPSNTDNQKNFEIIIKTINELCEKEKTKCIFPMHPRLALKKEFVSKFKNILVTEPLGYLELLNLQKHSKTIFTDSGGIKEESCILHKKCVILRLNTERPETIKVGGAMVLKSISKKEILRVYDQLIKKKVNWYNPFGDGKTAEKIFKILKK